MSETLKQIQEALLRDDTGDWPITPDLSWLVSVGAALARIRPIVDDLEARLASATEQVERLTKERDEARQLAGVDTEKLVWVTRDELGEWTQAQIALAALRQQVEDVRAWATAGWKNAVDADPYRDAIRWAGYRDALRDVLSRLPAPDGQKQATDSDTQV